MAEALNLTDDRRPERRSEALVLLDRLERTAAFPGAARIGITGAPGAGKSTLLDALVRTLRPRGETLAIVAVDPSSRETGGALLGDRIRVRSGAADPGVYIRSMAARDRLGGLAEATRAGVAILAAAFDRVFIETVGVGQSEVGVASLADTLVYVVNPGTGDALQFMKAGVIELPDVFVVNKCDVGPEASRTAAELESGLAAAGGGERCVVQVSARDGTGVEALVDALDAHRRELEAGGGLEERRARGRAAYVLETLELRYGSYGLDELGGRRALRARIREQAERSSFGLVADLSREIEEKLAGAVR